MDDPELLVRCDCHTPEHQIILTFDPEDDTPFLYAMIHLTPQSFWRRLKYLFGYRCRYGAFQELVLSDATVAKIEDFFFRFRNERKA